MFGFGKKQQKEAIPAPGLPTDQILALKQRGMNNDQIVPELEKQGYNSSQIFDALNQVGNSGGNVSMEQPNMGMPPPNYSQPSYPGAPQQTEETPEQADFIKKEQIEEIAEAIIDEKWTEFEQDIKVIIEWKEKTEAKVVQIEQQLKDLSNNLNSLHKSVLNKISEYDANITDVGTEIKAMEKVFQKVLPNLTENVNKLDRLAKSSKLSKK